MARIDAGCGPTQISPAPRPPRRSRHFRRGSHSPGWIASAPVALRGRDDLLADEIALARRRRPDMHRLVGLAHVQRLRVGIGIDGDACRMPSRRAVRMIRQAISPRLAMSRRSDHANASARGRGRRDGWRSLRSTAASVHQASAILLCFRCPVAPCTAQKHRLAYVRGLTARGRCRSADRSRHIRAPHHLARAVGASPPPSR